MAPERGSVICHVCGGVLDLVGAYARLHRVTSDCRAWPAGGRLGVCRDCRTAQKAVDDAWRDEVARIYAGYDIYHQSGGAEQPAFGASTGVPEARSAVLVRSLLAAVRFADTGRLLDIGCGNGALLRAFAARRPQWRLSGVEMGDRYRAAVESIPGVEEFHPGPLDTLAARPFDAISMVHVLEHIENPAAFLRGLRPRLAPGGMLIIEVPDCERNPFDLTIADHCSHLSRQTLERILVQAGFGVVAVSTDWLPREISVICSPDASPSADASGAGEAPARTIRAHVGRLAAGAERARAMAASGVRFGIFGTSIGGTWLFAESGGHAAFFVDEDAARAHRRYLDRDVWLPREVPAGTTVLLPLAEPARGAVMRRLAGLRLELVAIA